MTFETQRLSLSVAASGRAAHRAALFRESPLETAERWALGLAWALMPNRIAGVPGLAKLCFDEALAPDCPIPSAHLQARRGLPASCTTSRCRPCSPPTGAGCTLGRISHR